MAFFVPTVSSEDCANLHGGHASDKSLKKKGTLLRLCISAALLLCAIQGNAQQSRQTLHLHVRPAVSSGQAVVVGVPTPTQRLNLSIVLPLRNQSELTNLLSRLYDPSSPDYHKFLSMAQFTQQFGPSADDYKSVVNFLRANGFIMTNTPANRMLVPISGTVAQVEKAFHIAMRIYQNPTDSRVFFSPDREPSLDLSVPVAHIAGLNNFSIPRSMAIHAPVKEGSPSAAGLGSGPGGSYLGSDMRTAYYGGTALTGSGQAVGLVEYDGYNLSDVNLTFGNAGQSYSVPINNVLLDGATGSPCQFLSQCSDAEQVLDIVQAIGMAPGLSQVRVYIGNLDTDILNAMASENVAKLLSISWTWTPDDPSIDDMFFEEFAAQGQSVFSASGDAGAFDPSFDNYYPPEDANVTAVGGTHLVVGGAQKQWSSETGWSLSGGGISPDGIVSPSWQSGVANSFNAGSTVSRNAPDVAMEADFDNYDCDLGVCSGTWGGTSFATPRWAAFTALVNQQAVTAGDPPVGFINPAIYMIGESSAYDSDFHDITAGNNGNGCCGGLYSAVIGYDLVTGWGSPAGQGLIDALAPAASVGFNLSASAASLTVNPGNSGATTLAVNGHDGFSGSVSLAVTSALPSGVTASFGTNPTSGTSVLIVTVSSSAVRGSYLVTVTGTSGALSATADIALEVNAPGFTVLPSPGPLAIFPGTSGSTTLTVTDYAGFKGSVNLAVTSSLPSGVTAFWTANPTTTASILTVTASSSTTPLNTVMTITAVSGALTVTTTVPLVISFPTNGVILSPVPNSIAEGGSDTATATVVPFGNFTLPVTLTAPQLPSGVTATFNPNPTTGTSVVNLSASSSATLGTSSAIVADTEFPLTVAATPSPTFTVGLSPAFLTMIQGGSATGTVTVDELNGFTGSAILLTAGLPPGVTVAFGTNPTSGTSTVTLTASNSAPVGMFIPWVGGVSGTQTFGGNFYLRINAAVAFTLSASPAPLILPQSSSVTDNIVVSPQPGFAGSVNLAVTSVLPSGVTARFSPNPMIGTSLLTLTASSSVPLGNYLVIIAGTSGTQTVTITLPLVVSTAGAPTTTTLSILPGGGTLVVGSSYNLTATVAPSNGTGFPTGDVIFNIGSAAQTVAMNSSGIATYTGTAPATAGSLNLSAAYQGTAEFSASASNMLNETVTPAVSPGFTVSGTTVTVSPGATSGNNSTITVTPAGGFTGSVELTATITSSPTGAQFPPTLSFGSTSPVNITGTNAGTAILTISTTGATSNALVYFVPRGTSWCTTWVMTIACILPFGIPAKRRRWQSRFKVFTLIVLTGGLLACGSSGNGGVTSNPGTTAGTYVVTVTGTSGATTATGTVSLTVQ